eukprot:1181875-Prorocentrum_minimum.AAC.2
MGDTWNRYRRRRAARHGSAPLRISGYSPDIGVGVDATLDPYLHFPWLHFPEDRGRVRRRVAGAAMHSATATTRAGADTDAPSPRVIITFPPPGLRHEGPPLLVESREGPLVQVEVVLVVRVDHGGQLRKLLAELVHGIGVVRASHPLVGMRHLAPRGVVPVIRSGGSGSGRGSGGARARVC